MAFSDVAGSTPASPVSYRLFPNGVALLLIDQPPANQLSEGVLMGLKENITRAQSDAGCKAIVIAGANGKFVSGADISFLQAMQRKGADFTPFLDANNNLLNSLENGTKPAVAAIDGVCLGGGLELAMGCNARICTPRSSLALPELKLGLIPGFGGTQRLPRLVGVQKATQMMLTSSEVRGAEALKIGLVDKVVDTSNVEQLLTEASNLALAMANGSYPIKRCFQMNDRLGVDKANVRKMIEAARAALPKKGPHVPHPHFCLDAIFHGVENGAVEGLKRERDLFARLAHTPSAKSLIHLFFAERMTSKVPGVTGLKPKPIRTLAVIGGGLMGSGIVTAAASRGIRVILKEVNQQFLDGGMNRVRGNLSSRVKQGRMTQKQMDDIMSLVVPTLDYTGFNTADMVIEAVIEDIALKQRVFAELEANCSATCILASNTSTINLDTIAEKIPRSAHRVVGLHFFSPAHIMPLLEIIKGAKTSPQVLADSLGFANQIRKTPVVVGNCAGFAVNRIFFPYGAAAQFLIEAGVDYERIDKAILNFGMPMGPLRMADMAGVDISFYAAGIMSKAYPDRAYDMKLPKMMMEAKRLGEKTGMGYYKYVNRQAQRDPEMDKMVASVRASASIPGAPLQVQDEDIQEMIMFSVINEACRVLAERHVARASDIDVACVFSMGFPSSRGGLMFYADSLGSSYIYRRLNEWYNKYPKAEFFKPSEYLAERASKGLPLSA